MYHYNKFLISMTVYALAYLSIPAFAMDRKFIENSVKKHLENHYQAPPKSKMLIEVAEIDPRIDIKPCDASLNIEAPENYSRNTIVKVYCEGEASWQMFISTKINIQVPILVTTKTIGKGATINATNSDLIYYDLARIRGTYFTTTDEAWGTKAVKRIAKGQQINRANTCMVCEGESVAIIAKSDSFTINTVGVALSSGSIGDFVNVKNSQSGKTILVQVNAINSVLINL